MDPYGSLEPAADMSADPGKPFQEAGVVRALTRGLRKRFPRCAERDIFVSWFHARSLCPRCGLRFEAEQGGFLGAMVLNYLVAIGLWLVVMTVGLFLTVPDVPVAPLMVASVFVLIPVPLWFYPRSKMTWAAIEWLVAKSQPE